MLIDVWGDYACFTRPEFMAERVTYDVLTPSAARGIVEAIYWHPSVKWTIERIFVLNPIKTMSIKINEVGEKISSRAVQKAIKDRNLQNALFLSTENCRQQRNSLILKDVHYVIEAKFSTPSREMDGKVADITRRRLDKGACHSQPYLGMKEYPANFQKFEGTVNDLKKSTLFPGMKGLGLMFYDRDYKTDTPMFFNAMLEDGCLDLRNIHPLRMSKGV